MWTVLWHRFFMALRLPEEASTQEEVSLSSPQSPEPDWTLISPQGISLLTAWLLLSGQCTDPSSRGNSLEPGWPMERATSAAALGGDGRVCAGAAQGWGRDQGTGGGPENRGDAGTSRPLAYSTGSPLLVFLGMAALLSLAMATFTQEPQLCLRHLSQRGSILMSTLKHLLSPSFLNHLGQA